MDTRELPHDLEAERALLGAMLIDKNACVMMSSTWQHLRISILMRID